MLWPAANADDLAGNASYLSTVSGVGIQLFDLHEAAAVDQYRRFLSEARMLNGRPVPRRLIDDMTASLAFFRSGLQYADPIYFVASYADRTPFLNDDPQSLAAYRSRYGEPIWPTMGCPVFSSQGSASTAAMLAAATGLAENIFRKSPGGVSQYDLLFTLTEASHCRFLAGIDHDPTVGALTTSEYRVRVLLEAVGDFEATREFRRQHPANDAQDEAAVLSAARLLAMLLKDDVNHYSAIPVMVLSFDTVGLEAGMSAVADAADKVAIARAVFREAVSIDHWDPAAPPLAAMAGDVDRYLASDAPVDATVRVLLQQFPAAVARIQGPSAN